MTFFETKLLNLNRFLRGSRSNEKWGLSVNDVLWRITHFLYKGARPINFVDRKTEHKVL